MQSLTCFCVRTHDTDKKGRVNLKVIFFGLGSIGLKHANLINQHFDFEVFAFKEKQSSPSGISFVKELYSWNEVEEEKLDVAFITNPTFLHIDTASKLAKLGIKLFIEKPISSSLAGLANLIELTKEHRLATYVAYNLRFHPIILELKKHCESEKPIHVSAVCSSFLPSWRKGQDHKVSYSSSREMGGGVLLDLSHEFDFLTYLLGELTIVATSSGRLSNITSDSEDYADILVTAERSSATIHLSYFGHQSSRVIKMDFEKYSLIGDLGTSTLRRFKAGELIGEAEYPAGFNDTYLRQLEFFFANIDNISMMNNLEEASEVFKLIIKSRTDTIG